MNTIERVILSHWHNDHSGGLLAFLRYRNNKLRASQITEQDGDIVGTSHGAGLRTPIVVDLHPDRPIARGIAPPPTHDKVIARLPADPTFEEIEGENAVVETHMDGHFVAGDTVYVSGEIPREVPFEQGLPGGMRWVEEGEGEAKWISEPVRDKAARVFFCKFANVH